MPQSQLDPRLLQLQQLQELAQPKDDTTSLVQMLATLYKIREDQANAPLKDELLRSEADYYKKHGAALEANALERPEERQARIKSLIASVGPHLYASGVPGDRVTQFLEQGGVLPPAPPPIKPSGVYGPEQQTQAKPPMTPAERNSRLMTLPVGGIGAAAYGPNMEHLLSSLPEWLTNFQKKNKQPNTITSGIPGYLH